jgi:hypothetical protein
MGSSESLLRLHCSSPKLFPQTLCHHRMPLLHLRSLDLQPLSGSDPSMELSCMDSPPVKGQLGTAGIFAELALESM